MVSSVQRLLTMPCLLFTLILCDVKNIHAEFLFNESLDEKYQRFKERRIIVDNEIDFIEEKLDELNLLIKRIPYAKHYKVFREHNKLLQKQNDLSEEHFRLTLKLSKLAEGKLNLIYRTFIAREYEEGEYEEKITKAKEYLKKTQLFNEWKMSEDFWNNDEIIKNYLIFVISCRTWESILHSDIAAILRKEFDWKKKDFIWAKYAARTINPKLVKDIKKLLITGPDNLKKELYNNIKNAVVHGNSSLKMIPMVCRTFEGVHNIVFPNKRKNIINSMLFHIREWFNKR
ncbi:hypothetical protein [Bartonella acomydis]